MKKTPENITAYGVFWISRSCDLENWVKVKVNYLKNSKSGCPATSWKKRAITRPNRSNGLGCRPSPEEKKQQKTMYTLPAPCVFSARFILQAQGRLFDNTPRTFAHQKARTVRIVWIIWYKKTQYRPNMHLNFYKSTDALIRLPPSHISA
jgi:hypothetical protein